ncbi:MAG TPA: hypothetical protein VIT91_09385 [Chthoniobacterales bacterium]
MLTAERLQEKMRVEHNWHATLPEIEAAVVAVADDPNLKGGWIVPGSGRHLKLLIEHIREHRPVKISGVR